MRRDLLFFAGFIGVTLVAILIAHCIALVADFFGGFWI